jgi:dipeptidyl aminopeptidase/acylaminoacyl peptidase
MRWVHGWDAAAGELVYAASTPTSLSELYRGDQQLTSFGAAFTEARELVAPERFTATSADGSEVEAWIMRPAGLEPGRRYPVLLNIHGGPFAQYGNKFFDEFHVYAGAGYAVVYPNPYVCALYTCECGRRAIRHGLSCGAPPPSWQERPAGRHVCDSCARQRDRAR